MKPVSILAVETVNTFASDCATPQNAFVLGNTVCAVAIGAPPPFFGFRQRRFQWVDPSGTVVRFTDITTDPQNDTLTIPTTGPLAQVGTWTVRLIKNNGSTVALSRFVVSDPANLRSDLTIGKYGPLAVASGNNAIYSIYLSNRGPDDALNVQLTDTVPANMTFASATQTGGPSFTCTNPSPGMPGTSTCSIGTLPVDTLVTFTFIYEVTAGTPSGTTILNTVDVSSDTVELNPSDNSSTTPVTVTGGGGGGTCELTCPADVVVPHAPNQGGAIVTYPNPTTSDPSCGAVSCSQASGTFFPVGTTAVVCSAEAGDPCVFGITVEDIVSPVISCPADISLSEDPTGSGSANVTYAVSATDDSNSVSVSCDHPSGSSFQVGTTTVVCTATDLANNTDTCSFNVTVTGTTCTLTCPSNIVVDAPTGSCGMIVNYPAPTANACGTVTSTPVSGSFFNVGTTTVNVTTSAGETCSFTIMVNEHVPPTVVAPDPVATPGDANCQGAIPDFTTALVASDNCTEHDFLTITQNPLAGTLVGFGPHNVAITVMDSSNNSTTVNTTFTVTDTMPPVITLNGANPITVECHTSFTDPGATAHDACAGDFAATASGVVDVNTPGSYTLTYNASDTSGNPAIAVTRTVNVVDTIAPVITLNGANPMTVECHTSFTDPGATALDSCAGNRPVTVTGNVNVNVPGVYTLTYMASDNSGHTTTATRTVNVVDTTAPTLSLNGQTISLWPPNHKYQTINVTNFVVSASDGCDGTVTINNVVISKVTSDELENSSGDGNTLNDIVIAANCKSVQLRSERDGGGDGRVYTITFRVKDASGNATTKTANVVVPHSNSGGGAIDSGPRYTVNGTCP